MKQTMMIAAAIGCFSAIVTMGLAQANEPSAMGAPFATLAQAGTATKSAPAPAPAAKGAKTISEDEAKKIALKAVPGKITDVQIEKKKGENMYVVEVQPAKGGKEVDVVIHMVTGKVMAIEN
jgi:uncharacterized membrane protein YkoI